MTIGNIRDSSVVIAYVTIVYPRARVVTAVINWRRDASVTHDLDGISGRLIGLAEGLMMGLAVGLVVA